MVRGEATQAFLNYRHILDDKEAVELNAKRRNMAVDMPSLVSRGNTECSFVSQLSARDKYLKQSSRLDKLRQERNILTKTIKSMKVHIAAVVFLLWP